MFKVYVVWLVFYKFGLNSLSWKNSPGLFKQQQKSNEKEDFFFLPSLLLMVESQPRQNTVVTPYTGIMSFRLNYTQIVLVKVQMTHVYMYMHDYLLILTCVLIVNSYKL